MKSSNIESKDLIIRGIYDIRLSNVRKVRIFPDRGVVVVKKNRDFLFDGQIFAGGGRLNLYGKNLHFFYDEFKVDLKNIDSVQLSVPIEPITKDKNNNDR